MTARELRNVAGRNFYDLRELERSIARTDRLPDAMLMGGATAEMSPITIPDPTETLSPQGNSTAWRSGMPAPTPSPMPRSYR